MQINPDSNIIILSYGQCIDLRHQELFYGDNKNPLEAAKQCKNFSIKGRRMVERFLAMNVQKAEFMALSGLMLCNERKFWLIL